MKLKQNQVKGKVKPSILCVTVLLFLCITSIIIAEPDPATLQLDNPINTTPDREQAISIGNDGSFNYSYPIDVPPGTNGLQPAIALAYTNSKKNGQLGIGWHLSGIGAITRRGSNKSPVPQYDSQDEYYLNGLRLIKTDTVHTDSAGNSGYVYHTESETYNRIATYNDMNFWIVTAKNGTEYHYGHNANSKIEAAGRNGCHTWALNKAVDTCGNTMLFEYMHDRGTHYINNIRYYAGSSSGERTVTFTWQDRTDDIESYTTGSYVCTRKRLESITTYSSGSRVKKYVTGYTTGVNGRFGHRYYFPGIGVFTQPDPATWNVFLDARLSLAERLNPYMYCRNNPLKYVDPNGLEDEIEKLIVWINDFAEDQTEKCIAYNKGKPFYKQSFVHAVNILFYGAVSLVLPDTIEEVEMMAMAGSVLGPEMEAASSAISYAGGVVKGWFRSWFNLADDMAGMTPKQIGAIGENYLKQMGGQSQVYFRTSQGGRYIDQLINGIAHESKVGYQSLTKTIQTQIAKDVELMMSGQISGSTWHFFTSPVTGKVGASAPLLESLAQNGIQYIIH